MTRAAPQRRIVFSSAHHWTSPIQVSAHHLARQFDGHGWDTTFLSTPVTPFHALGLREAEIRSRLRAWARGRHTDRRTQVRALTPMTLLPLSGSLSLDRPRMLDAWHRWTLPRLDPFLRDLVSVDVAVVDTAWYSFLFDALRPRVRIFRLTDFNPGFASAAPAMERREARAVAEADLVVVTDASLSARARALHASRVLVVPTAVDVAHFRADAPVPPEYAALRGPIAVYVGSMREWFAYDLLEQVAAARPNITFVLIGPPAKARGRFDHLPNVRLLGPRPYQVIAGYLRHADVGIIPFDRAGHPELVDHVNPLKLYEYLAAGLPVVATPWSALEALGTPSLLADTPTAFASALDTALARGAALSHEGLRWVSAHDWQTRYTLLADAIEDLVPRREAGG